MPSNKFSRYILPVIVISQFGCTSLWFAVNAILNDLTTAFQLPEASLGYLTSSVQFGFIAGTLVFAILTISDRFAPSRVFFTCAVIGALLNLTVVLPFHSMFTLLTVRFAVGFCLAGIYPVGMKIAADYFEHGLGKSLGYLVGALVLGTSFPHLLSSLDLNLSWQVTLFATSGLALLGGILILLVGDGPNRKSASQFDPTAIFKVFKNKNFRSAALGYFGHMWELYAFWAFVPVMLISYMPDVNVALWAFLIIAIGGLACVLGGYISLKIGPAKVAFSALLISGLCCLLSGMIFSLSSELLKLAFLMIWGFTVVMDSPQFSTLVAQNAPSESKGTALTIVNSVGFLITIFSIQLLNALVLVTAHPAVYSLLFIGPLLGLIAIRKQ